MIWLVVALLIVLWLGGVLLDLVGNLVHIVLAVAIIAGAYALYQRYLARR